MLDSRFWIIGCWTCHGAAAELRSRIPHPPGFGPWALRPEPAHDRVRVRVRSQIMDPRSKTLPPGQCKSVSFRTRPRGPRRNLGHSEVRPRRIPAERDVKSGARRHRQTQHCFICVDLRDLGFLPGRGQRQSSNGSLDWLSRRSTVEGAQIPPQPGACPERGSDRDRRGRPRSE